MNLSTLVNNVANVLVHLFTARVFLEQLQAVFPLWCMSLVPIR